MYSHRVKVGVFVLEGLNAVATALFFNYLFFLLRAELGFTNLENLSVCALNGLVYGTAAWFGGQFAQRRGYFFSLRLGFSLMALALIAASQARSPLGHVAGMFWWTVGMALTWPTLEALTSEREPPARLQRLLGIYNVVWAVGSGSAAFAGGALLEKLGRNSTFLVPAAIHLAQLVLLGRIQRLSQRETAAVSSAAATERPAPSHAARVSAVPGPSAGFLRLAWVANPLAYVAMNALVPVIPRLAERFGLTPMFAGFFCSVWYFARALSFVGLWLWTGWHYRFRWLFTAYIAMAGAFVVVLLGTRLWLLLAAQIVFGFGVGLLYYSSLFYSMDVGETKGEHGGFHEAAIGAGIFAGPALGALSLRFFPAWPNMNVWAVATVLAAGLGWLTALRWRQRR